jgi:SAM-dependent methyltransferase
VTQLGDVRGPEKWAGTAGAFAASFAHLCVGAVDPLLEGVGISDHSGQGLRLLDVGTGTGSVAARAAALGANVSAVEPDPGMRRLATQAVPGIDVVAGTAPGLPFGDDSFDVVVANFVLNHVGDPRAAIRDMARVTAPGGQVGVTIWPADRGALGRIWAGVVAVAGVVEPEQAPLSEDKDFPRSPDGLNGLWVGVGLSRVHTRLVEWQFRIDPARLWRGPAGGVADIGKIVTRQSQDVRVRMKRQYERLIAPLLDGGDLVLPTTAVLATGTAHRCRRLGPRQVEALPDG